MMVTMQMIEGEQFYTADEACAVLMVKPATLYAYVSRGRLRSFRLGIRRKRLYRRDEVDALARLTPNRGLELPAADPWGDNH
ncbi:MAG TPA: helix-turn-helix domain-containing protein [Chloroflexota bacterium]|nr:helix-turn-helix domain-containing protein [Chloroflexota bacterium]